METMNTNDLYFKDCFTETENGMDLEVNNLTVGCISSSENNFNLDLDGNLTVKTITATDQILSEGSSTGGTFVGDTSIWFGGLDKIPVTHMLCDGQILNISDYPSLFDRIGNTYGGNGTTTFALPNLKGKTVVHFDSSQSEFSSLGQAGGDKKHTLTTNEMPSHNHPVVYYANKKRISLDTGGNQYNVSWGTNGADNSLQFTANDTGGGQAHNNLQPYIVGYYIMKVTGDPYTEDLNNLDTKMRELEERLNDLSSGGSTGVDLSTVYPVGSIYMSVNNVSPDSLFGGVWTSWGAGRVPVGIDTAQTEFNTVEKSGGVKAHTHTSTAHTHNIDSCVALINTNAAAVDILGKTYNWTSGERANCSSYTGSGRANNWAVQTRGNTSSTTPSDTGSASTLQPYVTCYMWKRVS